MVQVKIIEEKDSKSLEDSINLFLTQQADCIDDLEDVYIKHENFSKPAENYSSESWYRAFITYCATPESMMEEGSETNN